MIKAIWIVVFLAISAKSFSQEKKNTVIYKYKKFQEFDLETIGVEGEVGTPEDLSLNSRFRNNFKNKLPYRSNFNPEIRRSIGVLK